MSNLKEKLEFHYKSFNKSNIDFDPILFPKKFSDYYDIETMAFIASIFSYGKIEQILSSLGSFLCLAENQPYDFILNYDKKVRINFNHRFYKSSDIHNLFLVLQFVLSKHRTIKNLFLSGYSERHPNIKQALSAFSKTILNTYENKFMNLNHAVKFMFPIPEKGSACKRMNLFLRWMVRKDNIDFGLWSEIPRNKLIIPVDTHIAKISKELKLTNKKNVSWKMAEEITEYLKKFDPIDPVKYDFALCHIGIRKLKF